MRRQHAGQLIFQRRLALNFTPEEVAQRIGLNTPSYHDLEQVEDELEEAITLAQIARLEDVLSFDIRTLLSDWTDPPNLSLRELACAILADIETTRMTLSDFETLVGWEVGPILTDPACALEWTLACLGDVCGRLGIAWQSVDFDGMHAQGERTPTRNQSGLTP